MVFVVLLLLLLLLSWLVVTAFRIVQVFRDKIIVRVCRGNTQILQFAWD